MFLKIAVLMTSFNRRDTTLASIESVLATNLPDEVSFDVFLTDDRSSDGTADAVRSRFPSVTVLQGSGSDYWAGGMRRSFAVALSKKFDYYLWLNDDSPLEHDSLPRMFRLANELKAEGDLHIIVGNMCANDGITATYGGVIFPIWWRRTTPVIVHSNISAVRCESFNGNCVLISGKAAEVVGNLDPSFTHGLADFDYGYRAAAAGVSLWVVPGFVGTCNRNGAKGTYLDYELAFAKRWKLVRGVKAFPPKPWAIFTRRHCGPFWFLYWLFPYFRALVPGMLKKPPRTRVAEHHR